MLFRRRKPANMWERVRIWLWPRRSFSRSFRYMGKRVLRISGSPHAIALGLAIGIFASFTPFFGFHAVLAILVAWLLSANIAAAAIGTAFANPLTIPFIFGSTYTIGRLILNFGGDGDAISVRDFFAMLDERNFSELWEVLFQLLAGALVLGGVAAVFTYLIAFSTTRRFRLRRAAKRAEKIRSNLKMQAPATSRKPPS